MSRALTAARGGRGERAGGDDEYARAVGALAAILDGVVRHPDDEKRRRLRRANPRFHGDVARHDGGCEALFAAGFHLQTLAGGDALASSAGVPYDEDDGEVFLVLREPDPISDGLDAWSGFFDTLKESAARVAAEGRRSARAASSRQRPRRLARPPSR